MPNHTYNKNFLTKVIFRIDFSTLLNVQDHIKEFQAAIRENFPILEPVEQQGFVVNANDSGQFQVSNPVKITWNFKSRDKKIECNIDENSLVIINSDYQNYSNYKEIIDLVLNAFYQLYSGVLTKRVGFRYINEIKLPDEYELSECINQWLYRDSSFVDESHSTIRGMSKFEIKLQDESRMNFSFGVFNTDYPEPVSLKEFVLDYDCFTNETIENIEDLNAKLDSYNQIMTDYFEKSIQDRMRELLNSED